MHVPEWLKWVQQIQAVAQSGLLYTENPFDIQRYTELSRIAAEMMAARTGADPDEVKVLFDAQSGYATPKVDIRGVVFKDERILLVRELLDGGAWTLPGGWAEVNETPRCAVEREVREEAGAIVEARKVLAIFDRNLHGHPPYPFHAYKLFILCELISEGIPDALETTEPTYFLQSDIPGLSRARVTLEEINRMFDHLHNPYLPTDFD